MVDLSQDALIREVDEDLRRDRFTKLWQRYGTWILAAAVLIVVVVAVANYWRDYRNEQRQAAASRLFAAAQMAAIDPAGSQETLRELAEDAPEGIAQLARLREAGALIQNNDRAAASAIYDEVAREDDSRSFGALATLLAGYAQIDAGGSADTGALRAQLTALSADGNPWRFSAREVLALLALQRGDREEARAVFQQLAADPQAPQALRRRAADIVAQLSHG